MYIIQSLLKLIFRLKSWFLGISRVAKIIFFAIFLGLAWFTIPKLISLKPQQPQYQSTQVQKGTLVASIAVSGQVTAVNSASVSTQTSGVVKKIYVTNDQIVQSGAPIAEVDLDMEGKQRSTQAFSSYQSAKAGLETAKANFFSTQSDMLTNWKTYMDTAQSSSYQNSDGSPKTNERQLPDFVISSDDWLATEAKYKNQQNIVAQAQTALSSAWLSYQQVSPFIYAPISGTITGFSLQNGSVIASGGNTSNSSTTITSSQKIASIQTNAKPMISVNLTEIDVPSVKIGNKATLTFDAFPGKTYTGKVVSIDTIGAVNSGVTTYPAIIALDTDAENVFANMSAQANVITETKEDVLIVPQSVIQNRNGQTYVRIMRNGVVEEVDVETGLSTTSDAEIISGLSEGDTVVTSIVQSLETTSGQGNQTQSPFGGFGGGAFRGGGFGGGAARTGR